jgi:hypothetical protein
VSLGSRQACLPSSPPGLGRSSLSIRDDPSSAPSVIYRSAPFVAFVDPLSWSRFVLIVRVVVWRLNSFRSVRLLVGLFLLEICFVVA